MKIKKIIISSLISGFLFLITMPITHAVTNEELLGKIEKMERRINELEAQLREKEVISKKEISKGPEEAPFMEKFLKEIEAHGFVDTSYIFNANTPVSPNAETNSLRVFDTGSNSFMLNLVELNVEKAVSPKSPVGFKVDLTYGDDAEVFGSSGFAANEFDLWQAYGQFQVPFSIPYMHEIDFKVGKFATLLGAEVIESPANWNFSRSYLFGYTIPFNHTGARMHVKPLEEYDLDLTVGIVNGWDVVNDNNRAKTLEGQIAVSPFENFSLIVNGILGAERSDSNEDLRGVIDLVASYSLFDGLSFMTDYVYGWERHAAASDKDASWDGVAGYVKYDLFDWWSIIGRGEFFHDRDGVRTGVLTSNGVADLKAWELTLTNEFGLFNNFRFRTEYRYDKANEDVFAKDKVSKDYQNTFAAEVIYEF